MSIVKFKKEKQKKVKVLSKIISVIAIIGKIGTCIVAPFILLGMVFIPLLLSKIDVKNDTIIVNNKEKIQVLEDENGLTLKYKDEIVLVEDNAKNIIEFKEIMQNNSKGFIIFYIESALVSLLAILVLMFLVFRHLQKLFNNIYKGDTPFTLDNVTHIKRMAYYLIFVIVVPIVINIIFTAISKTDLNINFNVTNLLEILFLFSMAYIFEYGYEIQLDSKGKIYGDENE